MTQVQRIGYWVSEWTVGFLLFYGMLVTTFFAISEDKLSASAIAIGLLLVMFGPVALTKYRAIQKSNARLNEAARMAVAGKMG